MLATAEAPCCVAVFNYECGKGLRVPACRCCCLSVETRKTIKLALMWFQMNIYSALHNVWEKVTFFVELPICSSVLNSKSNNSGTIKVHKHFKLNSFSYISVPPWRNYNTAQGTIMLGTISFPGLCDYSGMFHYSISPGIRCLDLLL